MKVVPDAVGEQIWKSAEGEPAVEVSGSAFEWHFAFTGRPTAAQVRAMNWSGDPDPYLAVGSPYGMPESATAE